MNTSQKANANLCAMIQRRNKHVHKHRLFKMSFKKLGKSFRKNSRTGRFFKFKFEDFHLHLKILPLIFFADEIMEKIQLATLIFFDRNVRFSENDNIKFDQIFTLLIVKNEFIGLYCTYLIVSLLQTNKQTSTIYIYYTSLQELQKKTEIPLVLILFNVVCELPCRIFYCRNCTFSFRYTITPSLSLLILKVRPIFLHHQELIVFVLRKIPQI